MRHVNDLGVSYMFSLYSVGALVQIGILLWQVKGAITAEHPRGIWGRDLGSSNLPSHGQNYVCVWTTIHVIPNALVIPTAWLAGSLLEDDDAILSSARPAPARPASTIANAAMEAAANGPAV